MLFDRITDKSLECVERLLEKTEDDDDDEQFHFPMLQSRQKR